jgi:general secretion pathway protein A
MYESFYGLTERPFALTPNPKYIYHTEQYREAEERLLFGITHREGFMVLTGLPGAGKTTLSRDLVAKLDKQQHCTALIFNPFLNGTEMLQALLSEFGVSYAPHANRRELLEKLNNFLLAQLVAGRSCVAIFDEAQHLASGFLEQIRVLSNLETEREKLIHIILVGQPELLKRIRAAGMVQLDQRVSVRCTLGPLTREETDRYIHHRLNVAGARGGVTFTSGALRKLHECAGGIPRMINLIADRALLAGFTDQSRTIRRAHVAKAVRALRDEEEPVEGASRPRARLAVAGWAVAALLVLAGVLSFLPAAFGRVP